MRTRDEILSAFTAVQKLDPSQAARLKKLEMSFKELATDVLDLCPESATRTLAFRKLLDTKMTCSQAITHPTAKGSKDVSIDDED